MTSRRMRVALIGSRGIPARYGGFETMMEQVAPRLVDKGFDVTVYCRSHCTPKGTDPFRGVKLAVLPTIRTKHLDTPIHTLLSCLHAAGRFDAAMIVNGINAAFVPLLRLGGTKTALHVDGIEKHRAKWGPIARSAYAMSERLSVKLPNALVTDSGVIQKYYLDNYSRDSDVVTYGVASAPSSPGGTLDELELEPKHYFLYVSRFELENNPHRVIEAYAQANGDLPLVMVGWAPYADRFVRELRRAKDQRVRFLGPRYGMQYLELLANAFAYIQATEVGGTHPALVEAMGFDNCVLVNDTPENREAAGDQAIYFQAENPETLTQAINALLTDPAAVADRGHRVGSRAREQFSWDRTADTLAQIFLRMVPQGTLADGTKDTP